MGIVRFFLSKCSKSFKLKSESCDILIDKIRIALSDMDSMFEDKSKPIEPYMEEKWKEKHSAILNEANSENLKQLKWAVHYWQLFFLQKDFLLKVDSFEENIRQHNEMIQIRSECASLTANIKAALSEVDKLFARSAIIDPQFEDEWRFKYANLFIDASLQNIQRLKKAENYETLLKLQQKLFEQLDSLKQKIHQHNEEIHFNVSCDMKTDRINIAFGEIYACFSKKHELIDPCKEKEWKLKYADLLIQSDNTDSKFQNSENYRTLCSLQKKLVDYAATLNQQIIEHNNAALAYAVPKAYDLIGNVEGRKLDKQQMTCIVKNAHNHLVIAGAGTGKTTTVVGKIKFLLKSKVCTPEEILVLSFTNASAAEMSQRIKKETECQIEASTFHKLGLNIITQVNGIVPKITQIKLRSFIKARLEKHMKSEAYLKLLNIYLIYNRVAYKSEFEFKSQKEYTEYLQLNPPITLRNEKVKSYGEMDIANFLASNGINYIYEHPYRIDTRTHEYGQYTPDFYLPDYDIYIEYFGIDKNGEVPSYFSGRNGFDATRVYQESMAWKRELHKSNQTTLIECFAYEKFDGVLLENLKSRLKEKDVKFLPQSAQNLWENIAADDNSVLNGIIELFETLINLIKSNNYTIDKVKELNTDSMHKQNNLILLSLLKPIFWDYQAFLREQDEIDFNDMINLAAEYVMQGKYVTPYKYIIVDEYQDISKARYTLLHSMRKSNDYHLFCVGDDWQSIYRFAGSDIGFILNFEKYWGPTEISKIETTYRFSQNLIEISGNFIMQNPLQIKKSIKGQQSDDSFALADIFGYTEPLAVGFMAQKLEILPKGSSVFFIGRYSFDVNLLNDSGIFICKYNNVSGFVEVHYGKRPDLKMNFVTAHKSKGLQADYVFIINNKNSRMGFPSQIQDSPILNLLLNDYDPYPYAEERRLFYVALTRAKKKAVLLTVKNKESVFAAELKNRYKDELKREQFECPVCGGHLVKKAGPYGDFFGCSNYISKGCTYKRKIK